MDSTTSPDTSGAPHPSPAQALLHLARPKQWLKNVLVFAAPAAAGILDEGDALAKSAVAFVCFCIAASGTYYLNDALDVNADRAHPTKRNRPVASGAVSAGLAMLLGAVLLVAATGLAFVASWRLALVVASYSALTVAYSTRLKNAAVVELATVAAGFVLRTIAGGVAVGAPISEWFLIVAGSGSMFMVTGKRYAELLELGDRAAAHRPSLARYSLSYLTYVRGVASAVAILAYCLWSFEKSALSGNEVWFQLSAVPFVLGILRYALLLDEGRGGAPEELVLGDRMLQVVGVTWAVIFAMAVRGG